MLYYMNCDTGKVIAREIGDEPFGNLWFEISKEEYEEALHPLPPANTGLHTDGLPAGHHGSSLECSHPFCVAEREQVAAGKA